MFQAQAAAPNWLAATGSARLCVAITAMLSVARAALGTRTRKPRAIIDQPMAQRIERITMPLKKRKFTAKRKAVKSKTASHRPRFQRKYASWPVVRLRRNHKNAPTPAVNINTGAQMCVIQRVKKRTGVVRARSSGEKDMAPT